MIGLTHLSKFIVKHDNLVIFDVGAHHGDSVGESMSLFPQSRIFAFEADRENYGRLCKRYEGQTRVQMFNAAVGQEDGQAQLYRNNYDATHSLLPFNLNEINRWADANDFRREGVEPVEVVTLDTFCRKQGVEHIDIVKLDIQGSELMALNGAAGLLNKHGIRSIFCEVEFRPLYEGQPLFWSISEYLMSFGYHFFNFVSPKVSEMGVLCWADAIFVNGATWDHIAAQHSAAHITR
jgi:FkbM family methyltransferase